MLKRFAVVKDWENTVSAEEECIKRIVEGAAEAGYACDVVDTSYRLISNRKKSLQLLMILCCIFIIAPVKPRIYFLLQLSGTR